jgi:hypothetical protein
MGVGAVIRKGEAVSELPQDQKDLLFALNTPGLCETVPEDRQP